MDTTVRAAILDRLSRDPDGTATSVANHVAECRRFCEARGWVIVGEYVDRNRSGYKRGVVREEFDRLLVDARAGRIDTVVAFTWDRLSRQGIRFLADLVDLVEETGVEFWTTAEGKIDVDTSTGRIVGSVHAELARGYSEAQSTKLKLYNDEHARKGLLKVGGRRPFGFECMRGVSEEGHPERCMVEGCGHQGHPIPRERRLVRAAARAVIGGRTLTSVAKALNRCTGGSTGGGTWQAQTVRYLLLAPLHRGLRTHHQELVPLHYADGIDREPTLTDEEYQRLMTVLGRPVGTHPRTGPHRHLLVGIVHCGGCGKPMRRATSNRRDIYRCAAREGGCGRVSAQVGRVDDLVGQRVRDFLAGARITSLADIETRLIRDRLAENEQALDDLVEARFVERTIDQERFARARAKLDEVIVSDRRYVEAVERRAADIDDRPDIPIGDAGALAAWWAAAPLDERRDVVTWAVGRVTIDPGQRGRAWDPSRVQVLISWPAGLAAAVDPDTLSDEEATEARRLVHEPGPSWDDEVA
jgi:site-specific DNA recombinase